MADKPTPEATEADRLASVPALDESLRTDARMVTEGEAIPVVEEELHVGKRQISRGRVRVRTPIETVEEIARQELQSERVEVTRVPVGREVESAPAVRTEGDVVIVPVLEEIMVIEKRLFLKEELHVRRKVETETFEEPVTLRRQQVIVERVGEDGRSTEVEVERDPAAGAGQHKL